MIRESPAGIEVDWPFSDIGGKYTVEADDGFIDMRETSPHCYLIGALDRDYGLCFSIYYHRFWGS